MTIGRAPWCTPGRRGRRSFGATLPRGREYLVRATLLRPLLTYALPVVSVRALLEMTRCYVALGDRDGARTVLNQVNEIVQQRPDFGGSPQSGRRAPSQGGSDTDRQSGCLVFHHG